MKLFSDRQRGLETIIRKFEHDWSPTLDLAQFLQTTDAEEGASLIDRQELLWELALIDLELRLKAGLPAPVERYLEQFPQLREDKSQLLEFVQAEFRGRCKTEPDLQWEEFSSRFPEIREQIEATTTQIAPQGPPKLPAANCFGEYTRGSGRFRLLRTHREGGLGKVWLAHDQELDREIVIKEIRDEFADDVDSRSRFARESVITSGLEHPGVVPVYGLGHRHDGRPYYAMRLIRGTSLRQAVAEFHTRRWISPGEKSIALQRLLNHFLDVCNTIEFAHQQEIIHRDLKPSNIMIGEFGETMVVDWGLAKDTSCPSLPQELPESIRPSADVEPSAAQVRPNEWSTIAGKAMGSPSYMSPEQALGQSGLGPATDVYGLGSTSESGQIRSGH